MQAHTNALPTDVVILSFAVPSDMVETILQTMHKYGLRAERESLPRREVLPYSDAALPGVLLSGARYRENLTQVQLSEKTGIHRRHLSEMENGKRPIGKKNARLLAEVLNIDPRHLLSL